MGVLQKLFGASTDKAWQQLSEELGGEFLPGGLFKSSKVQLRHRQWTITLDVYSESSGESSAIYTRLRAPYLNRGAFRFTIYRQEFFDKLGRFLGLQDVEIGVSGFDEAFIIKGTDENQLRALFADHPIRALVERQPGIHLTVRDDEGWFKRRFPAEVDELLLKAPGVVADVDRLKSMFELVARVLDRLYEIGSAYEDNPGVEL